MKHPGTASLALALSLQFEGAVAEPPNYRQPVDRLRDSFSDLFHYVTPEGNRTIAKGDSLYEWMNSCLDGRFTGFPIDVTTPPANTRGFCAGSRLLDQAEDRRGWLWMLPAPPHSPPGSRELNTAFFHRWWVLLFEIANLMGHESLSAPEAAASRGQMDKETFATAKVRAEIASLRRAAALFEGLLGPLLRKLPHNETSFERWQQSLARNDVHVRYFQEHLRYYGTVYDSLTNKRPEDEK